jgi:large subunit ribosomal protein L14
MIQKGTKLNIIDNSGGKLGRCIQIYNGYKRRYAFIGNLILVSVLELRSKRRLTSKVKKGELCKALIVRTKILTRLNNQDFTQFKENSIVLLTKQHKNLGTRIFGSLPKQLRATRFFKLLFLASGVI